MLIWLILVKFALTKLNYMALSELEQDLGFEPAVDEQHVETPQPQVETPQVQPQVEQAQPQVQPQTDEVLSLNDEVSPTATPTPAAETLTPTLEIDKGAILSELFGINDPEAIKQKLSQLEQLQAEVEKPRYQSKFAEYIDGLVAKYGDPTTQADVFKKTIDILTTDVDGLDEKTAVAFQMKQEYPSLTDGEIETLLNGKYNLNDYATEEQQNLGKIQLKLDSQKAKLSIKEIQANALKDVPSKAAELRQVDQQKRALEWEQKSKDVAAQINSFEFEVEKGKKMRFDIPSTDKALLADVAKDIAINSGIMPDTNGMKQIEDIVKMSYVYQNANKLVSNAYKKGLSVANAEWSAKVNNPSALKNTAGGLDFNAKPKGEGEFDENDILSWLSGGR